MPRTLPGVTSVPGNRWVQVIGIWVPAFTRYRITQVFPTSGRIRWRRFSAGFPWYWEGDFGGSPVGIFDFVLTDVYVSLELYKDEVRSSSYEFRVEQIPI